MSDTVIARNSVHTDNVPVTLWEQVACSRWGSYISHIERDAILRADLLARNTGNGIEVGCEGGRWSQLLTNRGWHMTCIDVDAATLAVCQTRLPDSRCILVRQEDHELPCETGGAGILLLIEVLPVMRSDWFIPEASRVLAENGVLVSLVWNRSSWRGSVAHVTARMRKEQDWYAVRYRDWVDGLRSHGFSIEWEQGFCWFPFRRVSNSRVIPFFVAIERMAGLRRLVNYSPWVINVARKSSVRSEP